MASTDIPTLGDLGELDFNLFALSSATFISKKLSSDASMGETLPNFTCLSAHCIFYKLRENHEFMTLGKKYSDASGRSGAVGLGRGWERERKRRERGKKGWHQSRGEIRSS